VEKGGSNLGEVGIGKAATMDFAVCSSYFFDASSRHWASQKLARIPFKKCELKLNGGTNYHWDLVYLSGTHLKPSDLT
jgi:hypothetical protein